MKQRVVIIGAGLGGLFTGALLTKDEPSSAPARLRASICCGRRVTVYVLPACSNVSDTSVGVSASAKSLLSVRTSRSPEDSPKSA